MGELQRTNGLPQNVPMIPSTIESVLIQGDVGKMSAEQRVDYYNALCNSLGLNPLTQPFEYLTLNGKVKLYAKKDCTDQLRRIYGISIKLTSKDIMGDIYVVTAEATNASGRSDESTGAVPVQGLKGEALANATMKAETKAKRRVTLSICGLGMLDESEIDSIPGAVRESDGSKEKQKAAAERKMAELQAGNDAKPWATKAQFLEMIAQLREVVGDAAYMHALSECSGVDDVKLVKADTATTLYTWLSGEAQRVKREEAITVAEQEVV